MSKNQLPEGRVTYRPNPAARAAFRYIQEEMNPYRHLNLDMHQVITLALLKMAGMEGDTTQEGKKRGRKGKDFVDTDAVDSGITICNELGGIIDGQTCRYEIHEVTAIGDRHSFEVSVPLATLSASYVEDQYRPSREEWENAT